MFAISNHNDDSGDVIVICAFEIGLLTFLSLFWQENVACI